MLRFRRYRVFLIFAVFTIIALYHFTSVSDWENATAASVDGLRKYGFKDTTATPKAGLADPTEKKEVLNTQTSRSQITITPLTSLASPTNAVQDLTANKPLLSATTTITSGASTSTIVNPNTATATGTSNIATAPVIANTAIPTDLPKLPASREDKLAIQGQGRHEVAPILAGKPPIHWTQLPEHFPVPIESIISLPSGKPITIPKIQHEFRDESPNARIDREKKLMVIKEAFKLSWAGYKDHAWLQDELSPVSGKSRNPFCGWAATLVDTLDTLWIMGMEEEFQEAVRTVGEIDFTTSGRNDIPLFETTIRYLGGLVAAYDLSGSKYKVLLDKAVELADVLMGAFDTPNRMPITYYYWKPTFASNPHRAGTRVVLAELGSLSVEFTRLAQITKEAKYYDAIARITNEFEIWQNSTSIPGLWPKSVDASGCKKPDPMLTTPIEHSILNGPDTVKFQDPSLPYVNADVELESVQAGGLINSDDVTIPDTPTAAPVLAAPVAEDGPIMKAKIQNWGGPADTDEAGKVPARKLTVPDSTVQSKSEMTKRQLAMEKLNVETKQADTTSGTVTGGGTAGQLSKSTDILENALSTKPESIIKSQIPMAERVDCEPQGLASPPNMGFEQFTFGGMADSIYEYLPKQYLLLGGLNTQYRTMYEQAIDAANKYLLFRPMIPEDREILVLGQASTAGEPDMPGNLTLTPEQQHLLCFSGGMYALGAKIFDRKAELDIAAKLTDGCVWAYESTTTGIMPEGFNMIPCENRDVCEWNQTLWYDTLDPWAASREQIQRAALRAQKQLEAVQPTTKVDEIAQTTIAASQTTLPAAPELAPQANLPRARRQLGAIENDSLVAAKIPAVAKDQNKLPQNAAAKSIPAASVTRPQVVESTESMVVSPTHDEYAQSRIKNERLPIGVPSITSRKYILRPEAIESVFIMYRVTGDETWREKGWNMFTAIQNYTRVEYGYSAIGDVTSDSPQPLDEMESFWLAETLKYFYLLFSNPKLISLDEYILNTEAHPFRRPRA